MKPFSTRVKNKLEKDYKFLRSFTKTKVDKKIIKNMKNNPKKFFACEINELTKKEKEDIIKAADEIRRGKILLFTKAIHFNLNWHRDFFEGYTWQRKFAKEYNFNRQGADIKAVWELNRCQHFYTLAQAYLLTNDPKYQHTLQAHIESWIEQNPYKQGVNWSSTLEVALRNITFIWTYMLSKEEKLLEQIYLHTTFIKENLTKNGNNHLIGELTGLIYASLTFPELKINARPYLNEIQNQMQRQTTAEGTNWEQSTNYHKFTTDLFLQVYLLAQLHNQGMGTEFTNRLEKMVKCLLYYPTQEIGDSDDSRVFNLGAHVRKSRTDTFSLATVLFKRGDFKAACTTRDQCLAWFLGKKGTETFKKVHAREQSGIRIDKQAGLVQIHKDNLQLSLVAGFNGEPQHTHTHEDALSITITYKNKPILIEAGTFSYNDELREKLRSQEAHNTIITEKRQATPKTKFGWINTKQGKIIEATDNKWVITHDNKKRTVTYIKDKAIIIEDEAPGEFVQNFIHQDKIKWYTSAVNKKTQEITVSKNYLEKEVAYRTQLQGKNNIKTIIFLEKKDTKLCAGLQQL